MASSFKYIFISLKKKSSTVIFFSNKENIKLCVMNAKSNLEITKEVLSSTFEYITTN